LTDDVSATLLHHFPGLDSAEDRTTTTDRTTEDVSGPCDEAEHANDPRCTGTTATRRDDDANHREDRAGHRHRGGDGPGDDDGGSNSGPGSSGSGGSGHSGSGHSGSGHSGGGHGGGGRDHPEDD
jgi:hypothetical protein